jgi:hypothetical protein
MGGYSNYSNVQQPTGTYGDADESLSSYASSQIAPSPYPVMLQKAPPTAPASPAKSSPQPSPQDVAEAMVKTMADIYKKLYSVKRGKKYITLGPKVGSTIPVKLVEDADMTAALTDQAQKIGNDIIHAMLKFNPQSVLDRLTKYYKVLKQPFPDRLKVIDENTVLTADEQANLFGEIKSVLTAEVRKDVAQTQGFFMLPQSASTTGTIVVRAEFAKSLNSVSDLAGTIAHELAHAYSDEGWRDFLRVMNAMRMSRVGKLEEGMATFLEDEVVSEWMKEQPIKTPRPELGYKDDPEVADSAATFIKAVSKKYALPAFFGGWVNFDDANKPQESIRIGEKREKKWKWPWH